MMGFILVFLFLAWTETAYPGVKPNHATNVALITVAMPINDADRPKAKTKKARKRARKAK